MGKKGKKAVDKCAKENGNESRNNKCAKGKGGNEFRKKVGKTLGKNIPPVRISLVVVGTGAPGTQSSLLLGTDTNRYLFNCGEGTQRLLSMSKSQRAEAGVKLAGLQNVFITHKTWENTAGLLGLAMTLEGSNNLREDNFGSMKARPKSDDVHLKLYGPEGIERITQMQKKFDDGANMNIVRSRDVLKDAAFTITPVIFHEQRPRESDDSAEPPMKKRQKLSFPGQGAAFAYICKANPLRPKINMEKCLDAGITAGPMVGKLQRGESVFLEDGTVVHPHQVTDPVESDDKPFLVVECPNQYFLDSLTSSPQLQGFMTSDKEKSLSIVVHMTPAQVYNLDEYQAWMKRFHSSTHHLVLNREAGIRDLVRTKMHQFKLNMVDPMLFPLLPSSDIPTLEASDSGEAGKIIKACSGLMYKYRGKDRGFNIEEDEFNPDALRQEVFKDPEVAEVLERVRKSLPSGTSTQHECEGEKEDCDPRHYPKVTFLGTGSAEPNKIRAQSCILVQLSKHVAVILDCGENSYGQLCRFYGQKKASQMLRKVKAIFVSHMHADHHLGMFTLLKERQRAFEEKGIPHTPVILMAPVQIRRWFIFFNNELEPVENLVRINHHQDDVEVNDFLRIPLVDNEAVKKQLDLTEYEPVKVIHCRHAFGVTFTHKNGFKLTYSGDTRPCDRLIHAGKDSDLLIHEATHEDDLIDLAKHATHTTVSEALDVGKKMNAKNIILTHFSQRYAHLPFLDNVNMPDNVGIAFDNMQVSPPTLSHLPKLIPGFNSIFGEELDTLRNLNMKRVRRKNDEIQEKKRQSSPKTSQAV